MYVKMFLATNSPHMTTSIPSQITRVKKSTCLDWPRGLKVVHVSQDLSKYVFKMYLENQYSTGTLGPD